MRYRLKSDPRIECDRVVRDFVAGQVTFVGTYRSKGNFFEETWEPVPDPEIASAVAARRVELDEKMKADCEQEAKMWGPEPEKPAPIEEELELLAKYEDSKPLRVSVSPAIHRAAAEIRRLKRENESLSIRLAAAIKSHAPCDVEQANKGCPENPAPWNPRAFARRVRQYLESMGRRNAALAIIPDDLFEEAKQEVAKRNEFIGVFGNETDDILLDGITRLVGFTKAHDELLQYRKVLVALK